MPMMGQAPVIPGLTKTEGVSPDAMTPMQMVAMMMGSRPTPEDSTTEKMGKIVQLLREVSRDDPRIAALATDALRLLIQGPESGAAGGGPAGQGPAGMPSVP